MNFTVHLEDWIRSIFNMVDSDEDKIRNRLSHKTTDMKQIATVAAHLYDTEQGNICN